jgi:hypothetical protein
MENEQHYTANSALVTGVFHGKESAERAYKDLSDRGYDRDEINVVMSEDTRKTHFTGKDGESEIGNHAAEGAGIGSLIGGAVGAITGAVAAIGTSLLIPGLGLVIAGPLAAGLAGAGAGGIAGGLVGALIGWGIPEEHAKQYESIIQSGGILIGVRARNEEDAAYFEQKWRDNAGAEIFRQPLPASGKADFTNTTSRI